MLDIATDLAQVSGRFGLHIEMIEVDQLTALKDAVDEAATADKVDAFREFFAIDEDCTEDELARAARTAIALDAWSQRKTSTC